MTTKCTLMQNPSEISMKSSQDLFKLAENNLIYLVCLVYIMN